ncbi:MAG TPA: hypothetical protein PK125_07250 [Syntrophorhabdus sp.]|jgi:hypothetical protein|nr:hypothetical protein [Syntrophorhabdus sp.]OQB73265.1 MAG: hypothetical protein BWX92_03409 [Deltaproteobacteria bacterium ADurb.Bin135]HNQ46716.1 hypothetical protein [Syntrophorhabdus sp.]HNS77390.1 hypothetical protein [Syntrophorhabdus sp.]HOD79441.1 hypothetical protein [Syntrophorhabdus sp.]
MKMKNSDLVPGLHKPPASIDILSSIIKTTAVVTLNLLEQLKKRIVKESKEYRKGYYF